MTVELLLNTRRSYRWNVNEAIKLLIRAYYFPRDELCKGLNLEFGSSGAKDYFVQVTLPLSVTWQPRQLKVRQAEQASRREPAMMPEPRSR